jgi:hypothetical protein
MQQKKTITPISHAIHSREGSGGKRTGLAAGGGSGYSSYSHTTGAGVDVGQELEYINVATEETDMPSEYVAADAGNEHREATESSKMLEGRECDEGSKRTINHKSIFQNCTLANSLSQ